MEDNTRVVLPGDRITTSVDTESPVVIGPGLRQEGEHIVALKAGLLRHIPQGNRWWIENSQKRYVAAAGESVLGVVTGRTAEFYRLDIGTAHTAILPVLAFEGATKRNRPNLALRSLVYCHVTMANPDMEAELTCVNPSTNRADGFGPLEGGFVFKCSLGLCRRLLNPATPILQLLGQHFPFEIAVGMNGRVWINSKSTKDTIALMNAIEASEYLNTDECKTLVDNLVNCS